jgi:hypothetical protein
MPNGIHFWTTDKNAEILPTALWKLQGPACKVLESEARGSVPLWRWYNMATNVHFWTTDPNGGALDKRAFQKERPACYVLAKQVAGTIPFYRWYSNRANIHFWTTDINGELLPKPEYHNAGPACFVYPNDATEIYTVPFFRFILNEAQVHPNVEYCVMVLRMMPSGGSYYIWHREAIIAANDAIAHTKALKITEDWGGVTYHLLKGRCS